MILGGYGQVSFGLTGESSCPQRLFKRMGRYSLKQIHKLHDQDKDLVKVFRQMTLRADRLGLYEAEDNFA